MKGLILFLLFFNSQNGLLCKGVKNEKYKKLETYLSKSHQITIPETKHHFVFITGYSCPITTERLTQFALKSALRDSIHYIISGVTITTLPTKNNSNRIIEKNNELFKYYLDIVMPTLVTTQNHKILRVTSISLNNIDETIKLLK